MTLSGKLGKLYVAQLDMYLSEVVGMSAKDIRANGFNVDKKVSFIRKHVLRNTGNSDQPYVGMTSINSLPTGGAIDPSNHFRKVSDGTLNIIPWAGNIYKHGQNIEPMNTCPIDNFLMMFDYLYQDKKCLKTVCVRPDLALCVHVLGITPKENSIMAFHYYCLFVLKTYL